MGLITLPQKHLTQPQYAAPVDYQGLGKGAQIVFNPAAGPIDLVTGRAWTLGSDASVVAAQQGKAFNFVSEDYLEFTGYPEITGNVGTFAMWCPRVGVDDAFGQIFIVESTATYFNQITPGGVIYFGGVSSGSALANWYSTTNRSLVLTSDGTAGGAKCYVDGEDSGLSWASPPAAWPAGSKQIRIGNYMNAGGFSVDGSMLSIAYESRPWTQAESRVFHNTKGNALYKSNVRRIYLASGTPSGDSVGSSSGSSTVSGVGASTFPSVGASSGASTVSGIGASDFPGVGSSSGVATVSGVGSSSTGSSGSSSGTSTVDGVSASLAASVGASSGSSTATGVGASDSASVGSSNGVSIVSGVGDSTAAGSSVGSSSGSSTVSGVSASIAASVGNASGDAVAIGVGASTGGQVEHFSGGYEVYYSRQEREELRKKQRQQMGIIKPDPVLDEQLKKFETVIKPRPKISRQPDFEAINAELRRLLALEVEREDEEIIKLLMEL